MFRNPAQLASTRAPCAARTSGSSRASCRTSRTCTRTSGSWCVRARAGRHAVARRGAARGLMRARVVCVCVSGALACRALPWCSCACVRAAEARRSRLHHVRQELPNRVETQGAPRVRARGPRDCGACAGWRRRRRCYSSRSHTSRWARAGSRCPRSTRACTACANPSRTRRGSSAMWG